MSKKDKNKNSGDYVSESTIDTPPKEVREPKDETTDEEQTEMWAKPSDEEQVRDDLSSDPSQRRFKVQLTLKLTCGRTWTLPLLDAETSSERVQELITLALKSRRNENIIESILDNPPKEISQPEATQGPLNEGANSGNSVSKSTHNGTKAPPAPTASGLKVVDKSVDKPVDNYGALADRGAGINDRF